MSDDEITRLAGALAKRFDKIDEALATQSGTMTALADAQAQAISKLNRLLSLGWEAAKLRDDVDNALARITRLERMFGAEGKP